jgi:hypothetical protein
MRRRSQRNVEMITFAAMSSRFRVESMITMSIWACVFGLALVALQLSLTKGYSIDEFTYSHGAWLVSQGAVPFRDFFETRFPLHYLILAVPFIFSGEDPESILHLRVVMLLFFAAIAFAVHALAARSHSRAGPIALVVLLGNVIFVISASEIRPDPVALAFFLWALVVVGARGLSAGTRGLTAGALVALSCLGSAKAAIYGLAFLPIWLVDVAWNARHRRSSLLGSPWLFVVAGTAVAGLAVGALLVSGAWADFYQLAVVRSLDFVGGESSQAQSRGVRNLVASLRWLIPVVAWGVIATGLRVWRSPSRTNDPDWVLLLALPATWLSYTVQNYAYRYSWIPFIALFAIFAGRGAASLLEIARDDARSFPTRGAIGLVAVIPLLATLAESVDPFRSILRRRNTYQHQVLRDLGELTAPGDAVYDNSGSYVTRPHAHSPHHTDHWMRKSMSEELVREVPRSIIANEAVATLRDCRFPQLAKPLKRYLRLHYQPYSGDLWLWGQRYHVVEGSLEDEFRAIKDGRYFVWPESAASAGRLEVGGERVITEIFALDKGVHDVRYSGPDVDFQLLWLPRNGKPYVPDTNREQRFSRVLFDP